MVKLYCCCLIQMGCGCCCCCCCRRFVYFIYHGCGDAYFHIILYIIFLVHHTKLIVEVFDKILVMENQVLYNFLLKGVL